MAVLTLPLEDWREVELFLTVRVSPARDELELTASRVLPAALRVDMAELLRLLPATCCTCGEREADTPERLSRELVAGL